MLIGMPEKVERTGATCGQAVEFLDEVIARGDPNEFGSSFLGLFSDPSSVRLSVF